MRQLFLVCALVCFIASVLPNGSRVNLIALGLAAWVATLLFWK